MAESVYKVIELVGSSSESWERAAAVAVERAAQTLEDLRIAEVVEQDLQLEDGKVRAYRVKMKISFRYKGEKRACTRGGRGVRVVPPVVLPLLPTVP